MAMKLTRRILSSTIAAAQLAFAASLSLGAQAVGAAEEASEPTVHPHIDLAFCIDTTGSMGGEIENVKQKTKEIVARIAGGTIHGGGRSDGKNDACFDDARRSVSLIRSKIVNSVARSTHAEPGLAQCIYVDGTVG